LRAPGVIYISTPLIIPSIRKAEKGREREREKERREKTRKRKEKKKREANTSMIDI